MRVKAHPFLLLTLTTLFWSGNFVMGRALKSSIPPISLGFWRWFVAFLIILPFGIPHVRAQWPLIKQNWQMLTVYGLLGVLCFNTCIYIGLHSTTATNALLLNSVIPILIVLLSYLLGGTPVSTRQAFGIAISLTGVLTIICRANPAILLTLQINRGDLWILTAVVSWALYTFLLRQRHPDLHPLSFLTSIITIGLVPLSLLYAGEFSHEGGFALNPANCISILYMALFPSVLAFIFWNQAVREVGPNKAGLFLYLMPVFGAVLSAVFLGESIQTFHLIGMALIFSGIHLTTRAADADKN
jgi:drug/metabolite transporter (DMT)-like permease